MKKKFLTGFLCLLCVLTKAQDETNKITQQQIQGFEGQVKGYVSDFFYYLGDLANSNTPKEDKAQLKKNLLGLFVSSAKIEVLSPSHPKKARIYPIASYLDIVSNYSERYNFVVLQFYRVVIDMHDLRDTIIDGEHAKVGNYSYWQRFLASNKYKAGMQYTERQSYRYSKEDFVRDGSDETKKTGSFYIISEKTKSISATNGGKSWFVLLGDIDAQEIKGIQ